MMINKKQVRMLGVMLSVCMGVYSALALPNKNEQGAASAEHIQKIKEALPESAPVQIEKPRKILVVTRCEGFVHKSIPAGTAAIRLMGEKTGAYEIDETRDLSDFTPANLARYDAVMLLSTTRLEPTEAQRDALLNFVRGGKGIIGIHAATDNFYKWEAGAKMMGGLFCGHPWTAGCTVQIKLDEPNHPINACFHGEAFRIQDEIYQFKDPYSRENQRILTSLDMDDPDTKAVKGGKPNLLQRTDNDFGITWVRREGDGRVFYCSLGHNHAVFWNRTVLEHYLAGIQYALGDYQVPDSIKTPLDDLYSLQVEDGQEVRAAIDAFVFRASAQERPKIEEQLLDIVQQDSATVAGKRYACRMLMHVASEKSVSVLASFLQDDALGHYARLVLQGVQTPKADEALVAAFKGADADQVIGLLGTLGQRRSEMAVSVMVKQLKHKDERVKAAAIEALGNVGNVSSGRALAKAKVGKALEFSRKVALLRCVDAFEVEDAISLCKTMLKDKDENIQMAALLAWVEYEPVAAAVGVKARLDATDYRVRKTALGLLRELPTSVLITLFDSLCEEDQIAVLEILSPRSDVEVHQVLLSAAQQSVPLVQDAALRGMGVNGDAGFIPYLIRRVDESAAFEALSVMQGDEVNRLLVKELGEARKESIRIKCIELLAARGATESKKSLFAIAKGSWSRESKAAIDALAEVLVEDDFDLYGELMLQATSKKQMEAIEKSIGVAAVQQQDRALCGTKLIRAYEQAEGESKYALLRALGSVGGEEVRALMSQTISSQDAALTDAAIRGLSSWNSLEVADQLLEIADTAEIEVHSVIAMRGYIRLANSLNDAEACVKMARNVVAVSDRETDLLSVISCVKKHKERPVMLFLVELVEHDAVFAETTLALCDVTSSWKLKKESLPILKRIKSMTKDKKLLNEMNRRIKENGG
ncbi:MAG: hypothetical protein CBE26_02160 [Kiritimatiellaceae bacterium TMED266]|nr:MAG: hypothetical protein CBE26_02160 [Kiritimatiellaceae bacterium TMED266]